MPGGNVADSVTERGGVYHASGAGATTWHGFAAEAVRLRQAMEPETRFAELLPIPTSEYPTPARRPADSRLDCAKLKQRFGWEMMDWRRSLEQVLSEL